MIDDLTIKSDGYEEPKWYRRAKLTHIITMALAWFTIGFFFGMVVLSV